MAFRCELDGGGFSSCTSPVAYSGLTTIPHAFSVRAVDPAGNIGDPTSFAWSIIGSTDTTAPGDVSGLRRSLGYRAIKLMWSRPRDADFDYVRVLIATGSKGEGNPCHERRLHRERHAVHRQAVPERNVYHRYTNPELRPHRQPSRGVDVVAPPSALLRFPAAGAVVHARAAPRLDQSRRRRGSTTSSCISAGRKILSAWPSANQARSEGEAGPMRSARSG